MKKVEPGPGQESVWDYPRPPKLEKTDKRIRVEFNGEVIADTVNALRVLETSQPPAYYIPPEDVKSGCLEPAGHLTFCEWKGQARYYDVRVGDRKAEMAAWYYPDPVGRYEALKDHVAFYAQKMDACYVDGEKAEPMEGSFYGGWITDDIVGPFKGGPGTAGW